MEVFDKISLLKQLCSDTVLQTETFYEVLEECNALKVDYSEYSTTHPIDCSQLNEMFEYYASKGCTVNKLGEIM